MFALGYLICNKFSKNGCNDVNSILIYLLPMVTLAP